MWICRVVPEKSAGCQSNDDCPYSNTCINQQCVEPCLVRNPCALNAECQSANHKANCKCPPGLIGDPFANCYKGIFVFSFCRMQKKTNLQSVTNRNRISLQCQLRCPNVPSILIARALELALMKNVKNLVKSPIHAAFMPNVIPSSIDQSVTAPTDGLEILKFIVTNVNIYCLSSRGMYLVPKWFDIRYRLSGLIM